MKYLTHYIEDSQTALFNSTGAFFAFSTSQFDKAKVEGTKYTSLGAGLICPTDNATALVEGLEDIYTTGIAQDMAENGAKAIIHRELANHEAQITGDIDSTVSALAGYPITREQISAEYPEYFQHCVDNDYF